jgi:hypothetical protein
MPAQCSPEVPGQEPHLLLCCLQCGCQCTKCCYGGRKDNCTSLANSTCPYTCLERNNSNCGLQFSVGTQVAFCDMQHPSAWPAVIQVSLGTQHAGMS